MDYKTKNKQVQQLKLQGIPFFLNGRNEPIVLRQTFSGNKKQSSENKIKQRWQSPVLNTSE